MDFSLLGLLALGFAAGAYGTIIGAGGGFLIVPALLLFYPGYGPEEVTGISLAVVWANAASGSLAYAHQRQIDYVTGLLFAAASAPGVVGGTLLIHLVPERLFATLFGLLLVAIAAAVLWPRSTPVRNPVPGPGLLVRRLELDGVTYRYGYRIWQGVALSVLVGFASSLFGIGGGLIHVPAMTILLHIPAQFAVATSHFILVFMSGGATVIHLATGVLSGEQIIKALALGAGAIPGAQVGARIAHNIRTKQIMFLLSPALVALAARLLLKGLANV